MLVFTNIENNNYGKACSYHNEPFKTAVAVKEVINLKYEMYRIIPQQYRMNFKSNYKSIEMPVKRTKGIKRKV